MGLAEELLGVILSSASIGIEHFTTPPRSRVYFFALYFYLARSRGIYSWDHENIINFWAVMATFR